ncbi:TonB-dependent receptor [Luteimonas sp. Y-2-2-4F]|nr:TonB-dependent receptor [Luteimonas sp. Y-2-2-4F]MCD9030475.1 TonB-dependent receptor [Luteimonas sp. Y-2-2-4F]
MTPPLRPLAAAILLGLAAAPGAAPAQSPSPAPAAAQDDAQSLDRIVVTGQRAAIGRALQAERAADHLVNVVASEDMGQFADQNVAESLQRVPGITLNRSEGEGRSVSVRGLPSSFTPVTVDGVRLGTSNLDSTSVSLDSVDNSQLDQIEVSKSTLPSQDADSIGGAIDLKTISAFSRDKGQVQLRAEGYYGDNPGDWGEQVSGSITRRLLDDTLGVAATVSHSRRPIEGYELEPDGGLDAVSTGGEDGPEYLRPNEVTVARETGERTRRNASVNLEFRPDEAHSLFLRGTWSRLEDEDLAYQDIWVVEESEDEHIIQARPRGGTFDDTELEKRLFFQDISDRQSSVAAGGRHELGPWTIGYQVDHARSRFDNPGALRGRFAVEEVLTELDVRDDNLTIVGSPGDGGDGGDPMDPGDYRFNQLLAADERRTDEITSARLDLARQFDWFERGGELAFGLKYRERSKHNDREEYTGNPRGAGYAGTLEDLPIFVARTPFGYDSIFPEREAALAFFRDARAYMLANSPGYQRVDLSNAGDYWVDEDVAAAYLQATFNPTDALRLIAGVRAERTESSSRGYFTEFDGSGNGPDGGAGTGEVLPLDPVTKRYTDWFPGLHAVWSTDGTVVVRASYTRGTQRPDFTDRAHRMRVQFETRDPSDRDLYAGNPWLEPLMADQFDASIAWYPQPDTVLQAAVFHKDIDNFFFDFEGDGDAFAQTPLQLPDGVAGDFSRISTVLNGESARVRGIELSWQQAFAGLPGWLSGLFAQANVVWADSDADTRVRAGESFSLPGQRDVVGNLSLGWENARASARVAANYQGEALLQLAGSAEEDVFARPMTTVDLNLRYAINDMLELHFDAVNLTDEAEVESYRGDATGRQVYLNSAFGRSYRAGLRLRF